MVTFRAMLSIKSLSRDSESGDWRSAIRQRTPLCCFCSSANPLMSHESPGIACSDHDHDPAAAQPHAISHNSYIFSSTSTNGRSSDKRPERDGHKQQPPTSRPPRFRHRHLHLGLRAASLVDVPSALVPNGKIIVLVSSSSSIYMEARTGAVDVRAEQRLEQ